MAGVPSLLSLRGNDVDRAMYQGSRLPMLLYALEHATAIAVKARTDLTAAERRKTDTEWRGDQPVPRRGYSSTVLNSSTCFRVANHVFRLRIMATARPLERKSRRNRYGHAQSARSLSRAATGRKIFWRNRFARPTALLIVS